MNSSVFTPTTHCTLRATYYFATRLTGCWGNWNPRGDYFSPCSKLVIEEEVSEVCKVHLCCDWFTINCRLKIYLSWWLEISIYLYQSVLRFLCPEIKKLSSWRINLGAARIIFLQFGCWKGNAYFGTQVLRNKDSVNLF